LLAEDSSESIGRMQQCVRECETNGISVLCFPEAILGGLVDFSDNPGRPAIRTDDGQLTAALEPLASDTVTSIVGFTELGHDGALYNAAAVYQRGRVTGVYRKIHPAIRQSVYKSGSETPVFRAGELTFGIVICNDSNYPEFFYQKLIREVDEVLEAAMRQIPRAEGAPDQMPPRTKKCFYQKAGNEPAFDLKAELFRISGVDLTDVPGISAIPAHTILTEVGPDEDHRAQGVLPELWSRK
jgi:hypothetical protein